MPTQRIKITCDGCRALLVTITRRPGKVTLSNDFAIEAPDPVRRTAGILLAVCPHCQGKTEFSANDLPQD